MLVDDHHQSGVKVPTYRLYRLDGSGRINTGEWINAVNDDDARSKARSKSAAGSYELWQHERLVERPC
jgi:hypothetical protein